MNQSISAKIEFENQLRKVQLTAFNGKVSLTWGELTSRLKDLFKLSHSYGPLQLTYTDEDGDTIIVDSDRELADVVEHAQQLKLTSVRFILSEAQSLPISSSEARDHVDDSDSDPDFVLVTPPGSPRATQIETQRTVPEASSDDLGASSVGASTYPAFQTNDYGTVKELQNEYAPGLAQDGYTAPLDAQKENGDRSLLFTLSDEQAEPFSEIGVTPTVENSALSSDVAVSERTELAQPSEIGSDDSGELQRSGVIGTSVPMNEHHVHSLRSSESSSIQSSEVSLASDQITGAATVVSEGPSNSNVESADVEAPLKSDTGSTTTQPVAEAEASASTPQPSESLESFLAETQPLIENVLQKLAANPQFIPELVSRFESQLSGSNWGISVVSPNGHPVHSTHPFRSMRVRSTSNPRLFNLLGRSNVPSTLPTTNWTGVICDICEKVSFAGTRYKCTECFDFDMCNECYETKRPFHQHSSFDAVHSQNEVWRFVGCDGCGVRGFVGKRYVCSVCPDFDLCARCYASPNVNHESSHGFVAVEKLIRNTSTAPDISGTTASSSSLTTDADAVRSPFMETTSTTSSVGHEVVPPPLPPYPLPDVSEVQMPGNFPSDRVVRGSSFRSRGHGGRWRRGSSASYARVLEDALVSENLRECRKQLESMGYTAELDDDVLIPLLERNHGNVAEVVRYLVEEGLIL